MSLGKSFELRGTVGMVASTHPVASAAGMAMLELGGNAFDAAVCAGLTLQVIQPSENGLGGDLPVVFWSAARNEPLVLCAQGPAPSEATAMRYTELGHKLIPGSGLLAACVPGAFGGWLRLLSEFGTLRLSDVMGPAIHYAERGHSITPDTANHIASNQDTLKGWPTSAALFLPAPAAGAVLRNPDLASTYRRLLHESAGGSREQEIERAHTAFYRGFVAEAVDDFSQQEGGLLTGNDLNTWEATIESPTYFDYGDYRLCKTGPWGQGPVMLQQLALLEGFPLREMGFNSVEYIHTIVECAKLAFADREAFYADPAFNDVPLERLLSQQYNDQRRELVGDEASMELRSGGGCLPQKSMTDLVSPAVASQKGDTVHVDIADKFGNVVSATPSGGWLQSSPTIPGLGFCLGTRAQMFWLDEAVANSLQPGKRPRTTLSPSLALRNGEPYLAFGTPGGDYQDQWPLLAFLAHVHFDMDLKSAADAPSFSTNHFFNSFFPRVSLLGELQVESTIGFDVISDLRARGHLVKVEPPESLGRVTMVGRERDGTLVGAATSRGSQCYSVGR